MAPEQKSWNKFLHVTHRPQPHNKPEQLNVRPIILCIWVIVLALRTDSANRCEAGTHSPAAAMLHVQRAGGGGQKGTPNETLGTCRKLCRKCHTPQKNKKTAHLTRHTHRFNDICQFSTLLTQNVRAFMLTLQCL